MIGQHWVFGGTTVCGKRHRALGHINQDAIAPNRRLDGGDIVGAVSDGHGAPHHYRSHVGASLAVSAAQSVLQETAGYPDDTVAPFLIAEWCRAVDEHGLKYAETRQSNKDSWDRVAYGATLLATRLDDTTVRLFQIGDGAIRLGYEDGRIEAPFGAELYRASGVDSLCSSDAVLRAHCRTYSGSALPDFVFLASDGFTNSFRDPKRLDEAVRRLKDFVRRNGTNISHLLDECLNNMAEWGSGDDSTVWLALRTDRQSPQ